MNIGRENADWMRFYYRIHPMYLWGLFDKYFDNQLDIR